MERPPSLSLLLPWLEFSLKGKEPASGLLIGYNPAVLLESVPKLFPFPRFYLQVLVLTPNCNKTSSSLFVFLISQIFSICVEKEQGVLALHNSPSKLLSRASLNGGSFWGELMQFGAEASWLGKLNEQLCPRYQESLGSPEARLIKEGGMDQVWCSREGWH